MEPVIAVLPPHVVDQIAAGEVIERPASVVKELVDNAIDAGASAVAVEVTAGGRGVIRVTDDGCGMSARSAMLALERHATSKLRAVEDLWELATAGFRGEALPSIASVSRMTLTTRRAGVDAATRIAIDAGRVISAGDVGAPVGTTVEVADLLYNMPARLKFLKGEATEASHITELCAKLAMAYPRIHVRLRHNGRTALDVPPDRDGFARAQALLGARVAARMVPVSGEESGVRVTAYLGAPELAQATARGVQLFVGRRPVRDRGLLHALAMGYGELVPRGRYPLAIVLLDLPAGMVDVNVHPQKLEVRFSDPAVVAAAVRHVVQAGVAAARWRDQAGGPPVQLVGPIGATGATGDATAASGLAPPALPFDGPGGGGALVGSDGRAATRLAERQLAEIASRQMPLGFGRADLAVPSARRPAVSPGGESSRREVDPRAWARSLREQTQASRAEEPRAMYRAQGGTTIEPAAAPAAPWFPAEAEVPAGRGRSADAGARALLDAARTDADRGQPSRGTEQLSAAPFERAIAAASEVGAAAAAEVTEVGRMATAATTEIGETAAAMATEVADMATGDRSQADGAVAVGEWRAAGERIAAVGGMGGAAEVGAAADVGEATERVLAAHVHAAAPIDTDIAVAVARRAVTMDTAASAAALRSVAGPARVDVSPMLTTLAGAIEPAGFFAQLRYLGQLDLTYLVCEAEGELVLIDQHAAHERVEFARLRERHLRGGAPGPVQRLLFPATLDATPAQLALIGEIGALLAQVGFDVEPSGQATLAVKAVPAGLRHGDPVELLRRLLHGWTAAGGFDDIDERLDGLLGAIACHAAVRVGDRLTPSEAESLLRSLDGVDLDVAVPHGHPALLRLSLSDIARRFGR